jgi:hypothetical protein
MPAESRYKPEARTRPIRVLLFLIVLAAPASFFPVASAEAAYSGSFTLVRGAVNDTTWVNVTPNEQVRWDWSGEGLIDWAAEIGGRGSVGGGDGGGGSGCVRADSALQFRIHWSHNDLWAGSGPVNISFTIRVENATAQCSSMAEVLTPGSNPPNGFFTPDVVIVVTILGGLAVAGVLLVVYWRHRAGRPKSRP